MPPLTKIEIETRIKYSDLSSYLADCCDFAHETNPNAKKRISMKQLRSYIVESEIEATISILKKHGWKITGN